MAFGPVHGRRDEPRPLVSARRWPPATWTNWYVWFVGPIAGGIIAGSVYWSAFLKDRSRRPRRAVVPDDAAHDDRDIYLDGASATPLLPRGAGGVRSPHSTRSVTRCTSTRRAGGARELIEDSRGDRRGRDRCTARRDRVHLGRDGVGGARDLGRRPRGRASSAPRGRGCTSSTRAWAVSCHVLQSDGVRGRRRSRSTGTAASISTGSQPRCECPGPCSRACSTRTTSSARCSRSERRRVSPVRRRCGSTPTPARRSDGFRSTSRRSASTCCPCRRTSSADHLEWARSTCAAGVGLTAYPCGDDRERKRRSGMENTPGIAGMAAALAASLATMSDDAARPWALTAELRDRIEASIPGRPRLRPPDPPHAAPRVLRRRGARSGHPVMALDDRGFELGAGSLCSGRPEDPSPVLAHIGAPGQRFRVGLGPSSTRDELDAFARRAPGRRGRAAPRGGQGEHRGPGAIPAADSVSRSPRSRCRRRAGAPRGRLARAARSRDPAARASHSP